MPASNEFFDSLETRSPEERHQQQMALLPAHIQHAKEHTRAYAGLFADVDPNGISSAEALSQLPVTRKSNLHDAQQQDKPFGGYASQAPGNLLRVFSSPGPIYEPEGDTADYWRIARALYAAGFRAGDLVHNAYSYHFTPAGAMMETGAQQIGAGVFPAGTGQTQLQVEAMADLRPQGYAGTPSFLRILLEKAAELSIDVSSLSKALVSGEALPPSLRQQFSDNGIDTYQAYATADLGLIAYESQAREGLIVDEGIVVEIVRPGTGDPVAAGEVGEVLVTTFNTHYPLIRFATGDLSAVLPGASPCGRTNLRIKGWMGRADQTTKVKGMFVHPHQVDQICKRHPEIVRARLVVTNPDNKDALTLQCALSGADAGTGQAIEETIRDILKLRGAVEIVDSGTLPNDGKVIDDTREYT